MTVTRRLREVFRRLAPREPATRTVRPVEDRGTWHPSFQPCWERHAACRGYPTWWWFAVDTVEAVEAFTICSSCEVRAECFAFALDRPTLMGIWGGTTYEDRQQHRRTVRQARAHPLRKEPGDATAGA